GDPGVDAGVGVVAVPAAGRVAVEVPIEPLVNRRIAIVVDAVADLDRPRVDGRIVVVAVRVGRVAVLVVVDAASGRVDAQVVGAVDPVVGRVEAADVKTARLGRGVRDDGREVDDAAVVVARQDGRP